MIRIAVDAMGGDFAPGVTVDGAVQAANEFAYEVVLVGPEQIIKKELQKYTLKEGAKLFIQHASEYISMDESPVAALKKKKDSSIGVGLDLLKKKEVSAFISAGNTGACVAAASMKLGYLPGIKRPGIAITMPTLYGVSLVMDVGANLNPLPEQLLQYAQMSDIYARYIHKKKRPTIGLLNIGEEESKGTEVLKETYKLLRDSGLNFIGNIEGRDIFSGKADCIICDGFVGNVVLKVIESIAETTVAILKRELQKNIFSMLGAYFLKQAFREYRKGNDPSEYGGAPLLGVDGPVFISHGGATAKAIKNAVKAAGQAVDYGINTHIIDEVAAKEKSIPAQSQPHNGTQK